jgi:hypothetical protein
MTIHTANRKRTAAVNREQALIHAIERIERQAPRAVAEVRHWDRVMAFLRYAGYTVWPTLRIVAIVDRHIRAAGTRWEES